MSHVLQYLFFTYIQKRNNATATYSLKFMGIFYKSIYLLLQGIMFCDIWATKTKLCALSKLCAKMPNELWSIWTYFLMFADVTAICVTCPIEEVFPKCVHHSCPIATNQLNVGNGPNDGVSCKWERGLIWGFQ